jgi:uncharacterized membrane protein YdjX (TVP38/TMEM64 family)
MAASDANENDGAPRPRTWWRGAALLLLAVALPVFWAWVGRSVADVLRSAVLAAGAWGELACVAGSALLISVCGPASLIYMTAGMVFGAKWGTLWAGLAAVLGSTSAFLIARTAFGERVSRLFARSARLGRFEQAIKERGLWLTLLLRLSLIAPIGPVSYALGSMRTRTRDFLVTSPAVLPAVFAFVYAGELAGSFGTTLERERAPWEWVLLGVGLLATIGAAWLLARAAGTARRPGAHPRSAAAATERTPTLRGAPDASLEPPLPFDQQAHPRMVGVEIEFLRLELDAACDVIVQLFGGRVESLHEHARRVVGTDLCDFRVELDSHALAELAKKKKRHLPLRLWERFKGAVLGVIASTWTPLEVVTGPIPCDRLGELDRLVHALGRAGAGGTDDGLLAVVGVHFNPTAPSDARSLRDYIRAYALLHERLERVLRVDLGRRAFRYATAYPRAYRRLVLAPDYAPDLPRLIDDYLRHNPTRNRGLDLLPLFAHLDPERVRAATDDPRVTGRPTFHFRLPNSQVSDPDWRITDEWRAWLEVERLAADPLRLSTLASAEVARVDASLWGRLQRMFAPAHLAHEEGRE